MKVCVLASGRGSNLGALLDAMEADRLGGARIERVISDRPDSLALARARDRGVPSCAVPRAAHQDRAAHERALVRALADDDIDLVVLAGYMRITGPVLLDAYGGRLINIHPSLLPSFPGLRAQRQAVEAGVKISGCTVHFVDQGMDTGPIIAQRTVKVYADDTEATLSARILREEHRLLPAVVRWLATEETWLEGGRVRFRDEVALRKEGQGEQR